MVRRTLYPPANRTAQWFADDYPGVDMGGIEKLLLHSTEGPGWPAYDGGAIAPTMTYHPGLRAWRQHIPLNRSARALQDPTGTPVRENRDRVVQVEIIGTCDPERHKTSPKWPYMPALTDGNLDDLADLLVFLHREWGVPIARVPLWLPYPASYGKTRARLSSQQYDSFAGVLGHQHASGNDHGDPGNIDAAGICARAALILNPPPPPVVTAPAPSTTEDEDEMQLRTYGGKTYAFWGFLRREIDPDDVPAAAAKLGKPTPAAFWEMQLHTPFDTLVAIIGDARVDAGDAEAAAKALAAPLAALGGKVDQVLERVPSAPPVSAPPSSVPSSGSTGQ